MKKSITKVLAGGIILFSFVSCIQQPAQKQETTAVQNTVQSHVLTAEEQQALTPDQVIQNLKDGNGRFVSNSLTPRNYPAEVKQAAGGQFPSAVIISCLDSRVPVENIFDKGIGDVFVGRVAGNFVNVDLLGSMEFGCKVSGSKVIVVLGHEACGAVVAAIDGVELGNITPMLTSISPAVAMSQDFEGDKTSGNPVFVEYVAKNNIINTISNIRASSPILKEMEDNGEIKIVGAYYDLHTGEVTFL
jgi:carbonic anhydrase